MFGRVEAITMNHRWFWDRWLRGNWSVHSLLSILSILRNMHLRVWVLLGYFSDVFIYCRPVWGGIERERGGKQIFESVPCPYEIQVIDLCCV